jgi:L-ascorbate metabolism protein UlaG (beta-lactamase superfamily)
MKIKKLGHCCLLIEHKGLKIMTDPGNYSTSQNEVMGVDYVFITHEHGDHFHVDSVKKILENNPNIKIITNSAVKILLDKENISCEILDNGEKILEEKNSENKIKIETKSCNHADIYDTVAPVLNTSIFIDEKLFYPGDAFLEINKEVEILALPVAGPWMKIRESIEYALKIKPKKVFPVHDGMLQEGKFGPVHVLTQKVLNTNGIDFKILKEGEENVF